MDPQNPKNNGLQNEDLIVWMRTAALPNFRKLYRKVEKVGNFKDGLPKGKYELEIEYSKYLKYLELASPYGVLPAFNWINRFILELSSSLIAHYSA